LEGGAFLSIQGEQFYHVTDLVITCQEGRSVLESPRGGETVEEPGLGDKGFCWCGIGGVLDSQKGGGVA
jgi:hypothetical protein